MKRASAKKTAETETPVFPKVIHKPGVLMKPATPNPKAQKRDNTFSQSRDTREDRGSRQMKTAHNPQTLPHGR